MSDILYVCEFMFSNMEAKGEANMSTYKIIRHYAEHDNRVVERGLTLEEAQAHCNDPETSSRTATSATARRRTKNKGAWFDGYVQEKSST